MVTGALLLTLLSEGLTNSCDAIYEEESCPRSVINATTKEYLTLTGVRCSSKRHNGSRCIISTNLVVIEEVVSEFVCDGISGVCPANIKEREECSTEDVSPDSLEGVSLGSTMHANETYICALDAAEGKYLH